MRQIVLDTETTGLHVKDGNRIVEIGCIELIGRKITPRYFHVLLNPECDIEAEAQKVHGLTREALQDKPKFSEIADEFIEFIQGAELLIHNADFDCGFLNHELGLIGYSPLESFCSGIVDTYKMARGMRPGRKNSLDALCKEFGVDNSGRQLHGALLDAELLADVYLVMTRGQESLLMDIDPVHAGQANRMARCVRQPTMVLRSSHDELTEHERVLNEISKSSGGKCVWKDSISAL